MIEFVAIADTTFQDMPELKALCPCAVEVKTCKATIEGQEREFSVGRVYGKPDGKTYLFYPKGDEFARKVAAVIFGGV